MLDELITHREQLTIKSKEEVEIERYNERMERECTLLEHSLKNINCTIKCAADNGHKWCVYHIDKDNYYKGMNDDIVRMLTDKGYGAKIHKIFGKEFLISIAMTVPFSKVENEINKYIRSENRFNIGIALGFWGVLVVPTILIILDIIGLL